MRANRVNTVIAVIAVAVLAGCSAAASPSPSALASVPSAIPSPSASASAPTASPPPSAAAPSAAAPSASAVSLAATLLGGTWRIVSATGITDVDRLSPVEFREGDVVGLGVCGFSSNIAYPAAGAIDFAELGWDAVACGDTSDPRTALKAILDAVTGGRVNSNGSVALAGPAGEVVLSR